MLILLLLGLAGLGFLVLLAMIAYGSWIAHEMTVMERVTVDGHPTRLGLVGEDVDFPSRGDGVPLCGWYLLAGLEANLRRRLERLHTGGYVKASGLGNGRPPVEAAPEATQWGPLGSIRLEHPAKRGRAE